MSLAELLIAAAVTSASVSVQARAPAPTTAFIDVSVIPMDRERVLAHQTVMVRGDRIVALGPVTQVRVPADAQRIDGAGRFLIPGLADMHAHLGSGDTAEVADELFALVANGVTTLRDMHDPSRTRWALLFRRRVLAGELIGPRIYAAGRPDNGSDSAAAASVGELKAAGYDFVKYYAWRRPVFDSVMAAANRAGLRVGGHVPYTLGVEAALQAHWASIEHLTTVLDFVLGHEKFDDADLQAFYAAQNSTYADTAAWLQPGYRLDRKRLRRLTVAIRRAGVWNCPTLATLEQLTRIHSVQHEALAGPLGRWFGYDLQVVEALQRAGAGLLLGTDWAANASSLGGLPGFSIHRELELFVEAGLTPYQALETGTRNVAAFLGTLDSTGTVAVGKRADLVLLKRNPLANIRHVGALAGVMLGGRWLPRAELDRRLDAVRTVPYQAGAVDTSRTFRERVQQARRYLWQ